MKYLLIYILMVRSLLAQTPCPVPFPKELTTVKGDHFIKVKITSVADDGITIMHDSGITFITFEDLPPEVKKLFTIDPAKEEEAAKARHDSDQQADSQAAQDYIARENARGDGGYLFSVYGS